jgi:hypothetical protein
MSEQDCDSAHVLVIYIDNATVRELEETLWILFPFCSLEVALYVNYFKY